MTRAFKVIHIKALLVQPIPELHMVAPLFSSSGSAIGNSLFNPSSASSSSQNTPGPSSSSQTRQANGHVNGEVSSVEDEAVLTYLEPTAYPRNGKAKWTATGRGTGIATSPVGGEIASYVVKSVRQCPYYSRIQLMKGTRGSQQARNAEISYLSTSG